jgi:C1A family cysteine protease
MKSFAFFATVTSAQQLGIPDLEVQLPVFNGPRHTLMNLRSDSQLNESDLNSPLTEDVLMSKFLTWTAVHKKSYQTKEEFKKRLSIYTKNANFIREYMNTNEAGEVAPVELELNKFADLTDEEYQVMLGYKKDTTQPQKRLNKTEFVGDLPASIDWKAAGKVTPVKDQGSCGSCWSFSTTGSIESAYWIKTGQESLFSEQ